MQWLLLLLLFYELFWTSAGGGCSPPRLSAQGVAFSTLLEPLNVNVCYVFPDCKLKIVHVVLLQVCWWAGIQVEIMSWCKRGRWLVQGRFHSQDVRTGSGSGFHCRITVLRRISRSCVWAFLVIIGTMNKLELLKHLLLFPESGQNPFHSCFQSHKTIIILFVLSRQQAKTHHSSALEPHQHTQLLFWRF